MKIFIITLMLTAAFVMALVLRAYLAAKAPADTKQRDKEKKSAPAAASVDLAGRPRPKLSVILPDATRLELLPPTKSLADQFMALGELLGRLEMESGTEDDIMRLYILTAQIVSRNAGHRLYTPAYLQEIMTADDCVILCSEYSQFLINLIREKN